MIFSLDPGNEQTAWLLYDDDTNKPLEFAKCDNSEAMHRLCELPNENIKPRVVIEMVASYGMTVGREVFETCVWIGRFAQACEWRLGVVPTLMYRADVKMALCHRTAKINDAVIRQVLIDRYGPGKEKAIGKKAKPGPLFGVTKDVWAALALAVAFDERSKTKECIA